MYEYQNNIVCTETVWRRKRRLHNFQLHDFDQIRSINRRFLENCLLVVATSVYFTSARLRRLIPRSLIVVDYNLK